MGGDLPLSYRSESIINDAENGSAVALSVPTVHRITTEIFIRELAAKSCSCNSTAEGCKMDIKVTGRNLLSLKA